jgi:hypothetical protein
MSTTYSNTLPISYTISTTPYPGEHIVTNLDNVLDPNCIYFEQGIDIGDTFSFKETSEINGWGVSIDTDGYPIIDSQGGTGADSFLFDIDKGAGFVNPSKWVFKILPVDWTTVSYDFATDYPDGTILENAPWKPVIDNWTARAPMITRDGLASTIDAEWNPHGSALLQQFGRGVFAVITLDQTPIVNSSAYSRVYIHGKDEYDGVGIEARKDDVRLYRLGTVIETLALPLSSVSSVGVSHPGDDKSIYTFYANGEVIATHDFTGVDGLDGSQVYIGGYLLSINPFGIKTLTIDSAPLPDPVLTDISVSDVTGDGCTVTVSTNRGDGKLYLSIRTAEQGGDYTEGDQALIRDGVVGVDCVYKDEIVAPNYTAPQVFTVTGLDPGTTFHVGLAQDVDAV